MRAIARDRDGTTVTITVEGLRLLDDPKFMQDWAKMVQRTMHVRDGMTDDERQEEVGDRQHRHRRANGHAVRDGRMIRR